MSRRDNLYRNRMPQAGSEWGLHLEYRTRTTSPTNRILDKNRDESIEVLGAEIGKAVDEKVRHYVDDLVMDELKMRKHQQPYQIIGTIIFVNE